MISAESPHIMWGRTRYPYPGEFLGSGNRCGHDPQKPRFNLFQTTLKHERKYPQQVQKLIDAIDRYYWAPTMIPTLAYLSNTVNQDGTYRQNRSEAREAQVLLLKSILAMTDFASLRVGTPLANGEFISRGVDEIARHAGLMKSGADRVPSLVWRHLNALKRAGGITMHLQYVEDPSEMERGLDGVLRPKRRARPAIKTISKAFLLSLGVISAKSLQKFRNNRSNALAQERAIYKKEYKSSLQDEAEEHRQQLRLTQALQGGKVKAPKQSAPMPKAARHADIEAYNRARTEAIADLLAQGKGRSPADLRAQVEKTFPGFDDWLKLNRPPSG